MWVSVGILFSLCDHWLCMACSQAVDNLFGNLLLPFFCSKNILPSRICLLLFMFLCLQIVLVVCTFSSFIIVTCRRIGLDKCILLHRTWNFPPPLPFVFNHWSHWFLCIYSYLWSLIWSSNLASGSPFKLTCVSVCGCVLLCLFLGP